MAERTCHNCVYACCDPGVWLRRMWTGGPVLARCANHPYWPGQLHDVPGVPCRNYRPRPATPDGDVRMIALGDGCYAYVDAADYDWLNRWNWHFNTGYAARREKGKTVFMHRQIMQPPKGMLVDHIDGNKANNCRCNLRVCTRAENTHNKRRQSDSSSRFKGVRYAERAAKWYARLCFRGQRIWLGYFDDEAEAARAYDRKAVEWFRQYARLNFPEEWPPERRVELYAQARELDDNSKKKKVEDERTQAGTSKPPAERTTRDAKRTTKRTSSHTETQSRRGRKTRDSARAPDRKSRSTASKPAKRKTHNARRKTKKKATSHAETQGRREGKRTTKSVRPKTVAPKGPEHKTRNAKRKTKGKAANGGTPPK